MLIGDLVMLNPKFYFDLHLRIGVIISILKTGERYHILWSDGSEAILSFFDLRPI
jgi:hypothetical protein|tara:strand:- start:9041 stop:9205 length:165 start_codon:yes stop_codon:yes gene_type:complete